MSDLLLQFGLSGWKPVLATLLLPPVPLLLLVLVGARLMRRRRWLGWLVTLLACAGLWLCSTTALGEALTQGLLRPPPPLTEAARNELRKAPGTAIVVLGAGRRALAPEYGVSALKPLTLERLHYGLWLARETGLPVAFSGGVGHGSPPGASEAEIAARIAERELRQPLRWLEGDSRDTRENAIRTLALLHPQGITTIVLVTHDFHQRRALHAFERVAQDTGIELKLVPAPMGLPASGRLQPGDWLPTLAGFEQVWLALREGLGLLAGA